MINFQAQLHNDECLFKHTICHTRAFSSHNFFSAQTRNLVFHALTLCKIAPTAHNRAGMNNGLTTLHRRDASTPTYKVADGYEKVQEKRKAQ